MTQQNGEGKSQAKPDRKALEHKVSAIDIEISKLSAAMEKIEADIIRIVRKWDRCRRRRKYLGKRSAALWQELGKQPKRRKAAAESRPDPDIPF